MAYSYEPEPAPRKRRPRVTYYPLVATQKQADSAWICGVCGLCLLAVAAAAVAGARFGAFLDAIREIPLPF